MTTTARAIADGAGRARRDARRRLYVPVLVGLLALLALSAGSAQAAFPGSNGRIVSPGFFDSSSDGIFSFDPAGTSFSHLTPEDAAAYDNPRWRADGQRIVYQRESDIWTMRADGSDRLQLTTDHTSSQPTYSPDGTRVVFVRDGALWTMNADGGNQAPLTNAGSAISGSHPAWSPDGDKIAFDAPSCAAVCQVRIWVVNADGANPTPVSNPLGALGANDQRPDWRPDGGEIAFDRSAAGDNEIFAVTPSGSLERNVSLDPGGSCHSQVAPAFSPDGTKIAYFGEDSSGGACSSGVKTMNASDGSAKTAIPDAEEHTGTRPDWGVDGVLAEEACTKSGAGTITGTEGRDIICGSSGNDSISGLGGNDVIYGNGGNDSIRGGDDNDVMDAGAGNDTLDGGDDGDSFSGGDGVDAATYSSRTAAVNVTVGNGRSDDGELAEGDQVRGDVENVLGGSRGDSLVGNASHNALTGGRGDDTLEGSEGNDSLDGGLGADQLRGADGIDRAVYAAHPYGVTVTLDCAQNDGATGRSENDSVGADDGAGGCDIEDVYGSAYVDRIEGSSSSNKLYGGNGTDRVLGGGGLDYLWGQNDGDSLDGDEGDDRLYGGNGGDQLLGSGDNDYLYGENDDDSLDGSEGNDSLTGGLGADQLRGAEGTDSASYSAHPYGVTVTLDCAQNDGGTGRSENDNVDCDTVEDVTASPYVDRIEGSPSNNKLYGGNGADQLLGGGGNDYLYGLNDGDSLDGSEGNDRLYGGKGGDELIGRSGLDYLFGEDDDDTLRSDDAESPRDYNYCGAGASDTVFRDAVDYRSQCESDNVVSPSGQL